MVYNFVYMVKHKNKLNLMSDCHITYRNICNHTYPFFYTLCIFFNYLKIIENYKKYYKRVYHIIHRLF